MLLVLALPAHADITGPTRVIDGDTIELAGEYIRLQGIDAPEMKQICITHYGKEQLCSQLSVWAYLISRTA